MIELVNGYVCHNCAEAALAKQGKDPSAKPGDPPGGAKDAKGQKTHRISDFDRQPATILDGALSVSGVLTANPVTAGTKSDASQRAAAHARSSTVDLSV